MSLNIYIRRTGSVTTSEHNVKGHLKSLTLRCAKKKKNAFQKAFYKINTKGVVMNVIKFHGWYSSTKKLQSSN